MTYNNKKIIEAAPLNQAEPSDNRRMDRATSPIAGFELTDVNARNFDDVMHAMVNVVRDAKRLSNKEDYVVQKQISKMADISNKTIKMAKASLRNSNGRLLSQKQSLFGFQMPQQIEERLNGAITNIEKVTASISDKDGCDKIKEETAKIMELVKTFAGSATNVTRVITGVALVAFFGIVCKTVSNVLQMSGVEDDGFRNKVALFVSTISTVIAMNPTIPEWLMTQLKRAFTWIVDATSLKEYDEKLYDKSQKQSAMYASTGIGALVLAATHWMHGGTEDPSPFYKTFKSTTKNLADNYRTSKSLTELTTCIFEFLSTSVNFVRTEVCGLAPFRSILNLSAEMTEWADEVERVEKMYQDGNFEQNVDNARTINRLKNTYLKWFITISDRDGDVLRKKLSFHIKCVMDIQKEFKNYFKGNGSPRPEPLAIVFVGKPGGGKSLLSWEVATRLTAALMPDSQLDSAEANNYAKYIFQWHVGKNHYDALGNQIGCVCDDIGQFLDALCVDPANNEWLNLLRMTNSAPYEAPMAALEDKGNTFAQFEFVICTSNVTNLKGNIKNLSDPSAIDRRLDIYQVYPKDEYALQEELTVQAQEYKATHANNDEFEREWPKWLKLNTSSPFNVNKVWLQPVDFTGKDKPGQPRMEFDTVYKGWLDEVKRRKAFFEEFNTGLVQNFTKMVEDRKSKKQSGASEEPTHNVLPDVISTFDDKEEMSAEDIKSIQEIVDNTPMTDEEIIQEACKELFGTPEPEDKTIITKVKELWLAIKRATEVKVGQAISAMKRFNKVLWDNVKLALRKAYSLIKDLGKLIASAASFVNDRVVRALKISYKMGSSTLKFTKDKAFGFRSWLSRLWNWIKEKIAWIESKMPDKETIMSYLKYGGMFAALLAGTYGLYRYFAKNDEEVSTFQRYGNTGWFNRQKLRSRLRAQPKSVKQSGTDHEAWMLSKKIIDNNLHAMFFHMSNKNIIAAGSALGIFGYTYMIPLHYVKDVEHLMEQQKISVDKITLECIGDPARNASFSWDMLKSTMKELDGYEFKDICSFTLDKTVAIEVKDIRTAFVNEALFKGPEDNPNELKQIDTFMTCVEGYEEKDGILMQNWHAKFGKGKILSEMHVHEGENLVHTLKGVIETEMCTEKGDCGSPVYLMKNDAPAGKLCGMHVAGTGQHGHVVIITRQMIDKWFPRSQKEGIIQCIKDWWNDTGARPLMYKNNCWDKSKCSDKDANLFSLYLNDRFGVHLDTETAKSAMLVVVMYIDNLTDSRSVINILHQMVKGQSEFGKYKQKDFENLLNELSTWWRVRFPEYSPTELVTFMNRRMELATEEFNTDGEHVKAWFDIHDRVYWWTRAGCEITFPIESEFSHLKHISFRSLLKKINEEEEKERIKELVLKNTRYEVVTYNDITETVQKEIEKRSQKQGLVTNKIDLPYGGGTFIIGEYDEAYAKAMDFDFNARLTYPEQAPVACIGVRDRALNQASSTKIIKSPLYGHMLPVTQKPALLRRKVVNGEFMDPYALGIAKFQTPEKTLDQDIVDACAQSTAQRVFNKHPHIHVPHVRTFEEAITGLEMDKYSGPLPRNTSAGFPWVEMKSTGSKGKHYWLSDTPVIDWDHEELKKLKAHVEWCIDQLSQGERINPGFVFTDTLKDERRSFAQYDAGKTRLFSAGDFALTIIDRMYNADFFGYMKRYNISNGSAVGANPYSLDWTRLHDHLTRGNAGMIAGDFSRFDSSQGTIIHYANLEYVVEKYYYNATDVERRIRRNLMYCTIQSVHVVNVDTPEGTKLMMYQNPKGMPSGAHPTTMHNTLYNLTAHRCAFAMGHGGDPHEAMQLYKDYINDEMFGDDSVVAVVKPVDEWFNQITLPKLMEKIGLTYTSEKKDDSEDLEPTRDIKEISFLKRGFRFDHEHRRWVAPLDLSVIMEMPNWQKKHPEPDQVITDIVQNAMEELSLYDEETFNKYSKILLDACREYMDYIPPDTKYATLKARILARDDLL